VVGSAGARTPALARVAASPTPERTGASVALLLTFLGLILLRVALVTLGAILIVRPVRACPACFQPTTPILRPWLERLTPLEWRWCTHCGWKGVAQRNAG
jgi:hypothetical protein